MPYEVIVVGGGIGGLTTAALLAARGVNVCLFERNESVGGCVANSHHQGYTFEPTAGLYAGWEAGGIHDRIFSELTIAPPEVRLSPAFAVRLPDHVQVMVARNVEEFAESLASSFPECAKGAVNFYRRLAEIDRSPSSPIEPVAKHLEGVSPRFRSFIDAQLQIFGQCSSDTCDAVRAATILIAPRRGLYAMRGGAEALASVLTESIQKNGGTIRLNSPVLRLAYAPDGLPVGVDLLSGETVIATRAIVSNLTVWDTYGKLVGLNRTPAEISTQLRHLTGQGAFLMFLALDESAGARLPADHLIAISDLRARDDQNLAEGQFIFAAAPRWDTRGPTGKRAVTVFALTNPDDWFTFHESNTGHDELDQETLEGFWARLHTAMPELGGSVEVIETVTPRTCYETIRRKFGMIGAPDRFDHPGLVSHRTPFPNLFVVGDTVSPGNGVAGVSESAGDLANALTA